MVYSLLLKFLVNQIILLVILHRVVLPAEASQCRSSCGNIPINYPFGIDHGCGSPYFKHILICSDDEKLQLRTPSGIYTVQSIDYYKDPHIILSDPDMWTCRDGEDFRPTKSFSLDTSTHLSLSNKNEYLFFNCSEDVIIEPKSFFCEGSPEKCDSSCDSASYLCRHMPDCASLMVMSSCCSYTPTATESLRLMLKHCTTYTSVYWKDIGATPTPENHKVPKYGIRVEFDVPVTTRCLQCQDDRKGGGTCGYDTSTESFMCLCQDRNATTYCKDHENHRHETRSGVITGSVISVAGAVGIGAGVLYVKKVRAKGPVTTGVQSNENRLF